VIVHPIAFIEEIGFRKINHETSTATATYSTEMFILVAKEQKLEGRKHRP
jgi:hypothetical protein